MCKLAALLPCSASADYDAVHLTVSAHLAELCQQHAECDRVPG